MISGRKAAIPAGAGDSLPIWVYVSEPTFSRRSFRPHKHKEFEIALFKSGSGVYKTMKRTYDIEDGDVFLFSTDEIHCVTDICSPMSIMNIKFEPRLMWSGSGGLFDAKYLQIFLNADPSHGNRLDRDNPHIGEIRTLMLDMESEFTGRPDGYALMIKAQLVALLVKIKRYFCSGGEDDFYTGRAGFAPVEDAMDYIDAHFTESLTLREIAAAAGMSPNYFCSVFKKLNGLCAWDYITLKRIEKAKDILRSDASVTMLGIAQQCGFSSTAGFNRAFKHCTGFTPTDFIKNLT